MVSDVISGLSMRHFIALALSFYALPTVAQAGTPQQSLYDHLVQQVSKSQECPNMPVSNRYCHPAPVTGSGTDAVNALRYMRDVERLQPLCAALVGNACDRQQASRSAVHKLGWCARPTIGWRSENVIVWAKCPREIIINSQR